MAVAIEGSIQKWSQMAAEWTSLNPTLLTGQDGFETDTFKAKTGDGVLAWNDLSYNSFSQVDLDNKVDKVTGMGLSEEDYTTTEKNKLSGIQAGATVNDTDSNLKNRDNHTGVQAATTIAQDSTHRFATDAEKAVWNNPSASLAKILALG